MTVQVLMELDPRLVGLHASDEISTATRLMVAFAELLLYAAVSVAV